MCRRICFKLLNTNLITLIFEPFGHCFKQFNPNKPFQISLDCAAENECHIFDKICLKAITNTLFVNMWSVIRGGKRGHEGNGDSIFFLFWEGGWGQELGRHSVEGWNHVPEYWKLISPLIKKGKYKNLKQMSLSLLIAAIQEIHYIKFCVNT